MASDADKPSDIFTDAYLRETQDRIASIIESDSRFASGAALMRGCGRFAAALKLVAGTCEAVYRNQCRQRLCPICATIKGARHRAALVGVIVEELAAGARFTLMTLTIPHRRSDGLKHLLNVLFNALKLFRKTAFFKKNIRAWARGIEVTWSPYNGFHPHVHFIVKARFISLDALHAAWSTCVRKAGGGVVKLHGIDLKGLKEGGGLNEAIGYPFKVAGLAEWPEECILELAAAVKGRHLFQCCRKWSRRIKHLEQEAEDFDNIENAAEVVLFRDYLEDVRVGEYDACAAASSVFAFLVSMKGLESAAQLVVEVAPGALRRERVAVVS
ncbi:MAG: protein rep [Planctomycetes bacterium]|nr:protein rep [Planctomycetota bacterium]